MAERRFERALADAAKKSSEAMAYYTEILAAAYIKATDIDPRDAVLCQQYTKDGMRIWFERKSAENAQGEVDA